MLPAPGTMLTPNLRLLSLLGQGGMGSVWLAEHLVLKTEVAVKLLSPQLADDPEALSRFRREATAIAQLKSPHVVRIHDVGTAEGTPFFVMERLEGEDLAHRLDRVHRLPVGVVTAIVVQMCKALARVHELGVVHRDLKPGNVFLTDVEGDLVIKLVDFGIAKQREADALHATSDGTILGTPLYMSPEQVLSTRDVTPASDLYSLAVVAYECFAGEPPFSGETLGALHVAIAQGRYTPISRVDPSLPSALDPWFARAFSPSPTQRFASAQEMAETFMVAARGRASLAAMAVPERVAPADAVRDPWSNAAPASAPDAQADWIRAVLMIAGGLAVIALVVGVLLGRQPGRRAAPAARAATSPAAVASGTADEKAAAKANAEAAAANAEAAAAANAEANAAAAASAKTLANANAKANASADPVAPAPKPEVAARGAARPAVSARPAKDHGF